MLTDDELKDIKTRCEKVIDQIAAGRRLDQYKLSQTLADYRIDVPKLVVEIERLRAECQQVKLRLKMTEDYTITGLEEELERLQKASRRLYKASFEILKADTSEGEWGELNTACFEMGEVLGID